MNYENIIFLKEGNIATITLNRPRVLNSFTYKMGEEILDAIGEVVKDDEIRALVITGSGRAFCAGDDLENIGEPPGGSREEAFRRRQHMVIKSIRNLRKPVIAAVNGNAHGMGSDIALACDFRIASENAKLGDVRTSHAVGIGTGGVYLLPKLVGLTNAIDLLFTGKIIDAKEAERIGLVNKTVPANRFQTAVMELARNLANGPTRVIGVTKAKLYRELHMDLASALEDELVENTLQTEDAKEGLKAFIEKRPPKYTGK